MTTIHWFRNDLRLHDHRVLGSLPDGVSSLVCIYVLDDRQWSTTPFGFSKTGPFRSRFLAETLFALDTALRQCGNRLIVVVGNPASILAQLVRETNAAYITTDAEVTSEELAVDEEVRATAGVPLHRAWSRTLVHPDDLPEPPALMPDTFTTWRKNVERRLHVRDEYPTPLVLPPPPAALADAPWQLDWLEAQSAGVAAVDERSAFPFSGGETAALGRLHHYLWDSRAIATYKETRNGLIGTDYSSKLSAWLALGAISPRRIYHEVRRFEREVTSNQSTYWLLFELLWRDFFRFTAIKYGRRLFFRGGLKGAPTNWRADNDTFDAWRLGQTGNDFVDANMRELLLTGWMSNRGRQNVASWLTKAKHVDWRWGAAWFEHALLDYDVCSNWGNWAYVAGVGNDVREDRFFNTAKQAAAYDPDGAYRRLWLER
jgi:deoxyribodipyrimidine photo-lyase